MVDKGKVESVENTVWAVPAEGVTLDELVLKLSNLKVPILERDDANNRVLISYDLTGPPPPEELHVYEEACTVDGCSKNANHVIPDGTHWCNLHLLAVRDHLRRERESGQPESDPHEIARAL